MVILILSLLFFTNTGFAADSGKDVIIDHASLTAAPMRESVNTDPLLGQPSSLTAQQPALRQQITQSSQFARRSTAAESTGLESYIPQPGLIIAKSSIIRKYMECSTICCFFSKDIFSFCAFLGGVSITAVAALTVGVSDMDLKNKLGLATLILSVATPILTKLAKRAKATITEEEKEYKGLYVNSPEQKV